MKPDLVHVARALGHPARVAILQLVADRRQVSVTDVARHLGLRHATVSYHLGRLYNAGIVTFRKTGRRHLYRPTEATSRIMTPVRRGVHAPPMACGDKSTI